MRRLLVVVLALVGCTSDPRTVTLDVTPGHESDAFSRAPAVTTVAVDVLDAAGARVTGATSTPGGGFSLGELPVDELVQIEAKGADLGGTLRVRGRSLGLVLGDLATDTWPVFVQRVGEFARPPGSLVQSHHGGLTASIGERFLLVTGGTGRDPARATFYDLLSLGPATGGVLPRIARSLVAAQTGAALLVIGKPADGSSDAIGATWVDFEDGSLTEVNLPAGLDDFALVAGGRVVTAPDGTAYLVGGSRSDAPSDRVLVVGKDRSLSVARGVTARRGAAATWVAETGLVLVGGSATGSGVETLASGTTQSVARPFPADATEGAAAVPTGSGDEVLLVGGTTIDGVASTRLVAARCAAECLAAVVDAEGLRERLVDCEGFATAPGTTLAVCRDASTGESRVKRLGLAAMTVEDVPLREPRVGATALPTPLGTLALLGGTRLADDAEALTVELWAPPP